MTNYGKYIEGYKHNFKIEIYRKDWTGDVLHPQSLTVGGLVFNPLLDGDVTMDNTVVKSTLDISFIQHNTIEESYFDKFFTADATKYKVKLLQVSGGIETIIWVGYITPDSYSYDNSFNPIINVTARDNFGYLDDKDFTMGGFGTIQSLVSEALSIISWDNGVIGWYGEHITEIGVSYSNSIINYDIFKGETWGTALKSVLKGYQLRYIGDKWGIVEVSMLAELNDQIIDVARVRDTATFDVVPSWLSQEVTHDYGVIEDLFNYEQKEGFLQKSASNRFWDNPLLNGGSVYNNYDFLNGDDATDMYFGAILMPTPIPSEAKKVTSIIHKIPASTNISYALTFNTYDKALSYRLAKEGDEKNSIGNLFGLGAYEIFYNYNIKYISGSTVLYMKGDGWSEEPNTITFRVLYDGTQQDILDYEHIINILSIPNTAGYLQVDILPTVDVSGVFNATDRCMVAYKSISFEPKLNISNTGIDIKGSINKGGNVKNNADLTVSETPRNVGGQITFLNGLFDGEGDSLTGWKRADNKGGVMLLQENIARSYAHLSNAFIRNGERTGGLIANFNIRLTENNVLKGKFNISGDIYIPTSVSWDLTQLHCVITARQITPYEYEAGYIYEGDIVTSDGKTAVQTGENQVVGYQAESGVFEPQTVRVTELATATQAEAEGSYLLMDAFGAERSKKYAMANIFAMIASKLSTQGGTVSGVLTLLQDLIFEGEIKSSDFSSGLLGSGAGIRKVGDKWVAEFDEITARQKLNVFEIVSNKLTAINGEQIISIANGILREVGETDTHYLLTFDEPYFKVGDYIKAQDFAQETFYHTRVTAVVGNTISVVKADCVSVPKVDDDVVQIGSDTDMGRQSAIIISAVGGRQGIRIYENINDKDYSDKLIAAYGYLGDIADSKFPNMADYGIYVRGGVYIDALQELEEVVEETKDKIDNIQIGGVNLFASNSLLAGYNRTLTRTDKGFSFSWVNSELVAAYVRISKILSGNGWYTISGKIKTNNSSNVAIDFADRGRKILTTTTEWQYFEHSWEVANYTEAIYNFIDIENQVAGSTIDVDYIMVETGNKATDWRESQYDSDKKVADAQATANGAAANAAEALEDLQGYSNDGIIKPNEKVSIKREIETIEGEKPTIVAQAAKYLVDSTLYTNAFNSLTNYIYPLLADTTTQSNVDREQFDSLFLAYYVQRQKIYDLIADTTKDIADLADEGATKAQQDLEAYENIVNQNLATINTTLVNIQGQIDGNVKSYTGEYAPSLDNAPANEWTTPELKQEHENDIFNQIDTSVEPAVVTDTYKFLNVNGVYGWVLQSNSAAAEAQIIAQQAIALAGTKAVIVYSNDVPPTPYNVNDVWVRISDKTMFVCTTAQPSGAVPMIGDWDVVNQSELLLAEMAADGIVSVQEKLTYRDTLSQITKEMDRFRADADTYNVAISALESAFNTFKATNENIYEIDSEIATTITAQERVQFNSEFASYNAEKISFANRIAEKITSDSVSNIRVADDNQVLKSRCDYLPAAQSQIIRTIEQSVYGDVVQIERVSGSGNFQFTFNLANLDILKSQDVVFYVIVKHITEDTSWSFGGWRETYRSLTSNSQYKELADGWRMYYQSLKTNELGVTTTPTDIFGLNTLIGTIQIFAVGVALGTQPPAFWSEAKADINARIAAAKEAGDNAQAAADLVDSRVDAQNTYIEGAFKDGVITESEANTIREKQKEIALLYNDKIATYNKVIANEYLPTSEATALTSTKTALDSNKTALDAAITAFVNSPTSSNYTAYGVAYKAFDDAIALYSSSLELANEAIQKALDALSQGRDDVLAEGVANAQNEANAAMGRLDVIDDNGIFSIPEKHTTRNEWYLISGVSNTTEIEPGESGSYYKALNEPVGNADPTAVADAKEALTAAYVALRSFLNSVELYEDDDFSPYEDVIMAGRFAEYFNRQTDVYTLISKGNTGADGAQGNGYKVYNVTANLTEAQFMATYPTNAEITANKGLVDAVVGDIVIYPARITDVGFNMWEAHLLVTSVQSTYFRGYVIAQITPRNGADGADGADGAGLKTNPTITTINSTAFNGTYRVGQSVSIAKSWSGVNVGDTAVMRFYISDKDNLMWEAHVQISSITSTHYMGTVVAVFTPINGADGTNGADGNSVIATRQYYALGTKTEVPSGDFTQNPPTGEWSTTPPTWENNMYLWVATQTEYTGDVFALTGAYMDSSWEAVKRYDYLAEAMADKAISATRGIALAEVMGVANDLSQDNITTELRAGMSGLQDDGVAFFGHNTNAYNIAFAYAAWIKGGRQGTEPERPNFLVDDDGVLYCKDADISGVVNATSGTFNNVDIQSGMIGSVQLYQSGLRYNDSGIDIYLGVPYAPSTGLKGAFRVENTTYNPSSALSTARAAEAISAKGIVKVTGKIMQTDYLGATDIPDFAVDNNFVELPKIYVGYLNTPASSGQPSVVSNSPFVQTSWNGSKELYIDVYDRRNFSSPQANISLQITPVTSIANQWFKQRFIINEIVGKSQTTLSGFGTMWRYRHTVLFLDAGDSSAVDWNSAQARGGYFQIYLYGN